MTEPLIEKLTMTFDNQQMLFSISHPDHKCPQVSPSYRWSDYHNNNDFSDVMHAPLGSHASSAQHTRSGTITPHAWEPFTIPHHNTSILVDLPVTAVDGIIPLVIVST